MPTPMPGVTSAAIDISLLTSIRRFHERGGSWPKAIGSVVDFKGRVAYSLIVLGRSFYNAGEAILTMQLKEAQRAAEGLERERDDAALEKLGRAFTATGVTEESSRATEKKSSP